MKKDFAIIDTAILSAKIPATARLVYAAIMSHSRGKDSHIFPSYSRIAEIVGVTKNCVYKNVKILENQGLLQKTHRFLDNGGCTTNEYTPYDGGNTPPVLQQSDSPVLQQSDSPYDGGNTRNKESNQNQKFKIFNTARTRTREETAAADAQCSAEQLNLCDCIEKRDNEFKSALLFQAKNAIWVQALRINHDYYLRPINTKNISSEEVEKYASTLSLTFGRKVRTLKHGQYIPDEVII